MSYRYKPLLFRRNGNRTILGWIGTREVAMCIHMGYPPYFLLRSSTYLTESIGPGAGLAAEVSHSSA